MRAAASKQAPSPLGIRLNTPLLQGAYLAFNAIPDAYFLGDGPSCIFAKAEHVHGRHDLFSTLLSCASDHRIHYTGVNVFTIAGKFEPQIAAAMRRIHARPGCGVLFMGSMPMCTVAGTDYDRLLREALPPGGKPAFLLPRSSAVSGDWLDGYASVLEVMAEGMDLAGAKPRPGRVALVGYLMDRNEGDHHGNIAELERMLRALGLEPASIWLSGRPYESLREARHAGAVLSLPHGRGAARVLARRLGVRLVEAGLPFGLAGTRRFLELLGREFGREEEAAAFIRREFDLVSARLKGTVPQAFSGRRIAFAGDPHTGAAFSELIEEIGGRPGPLLLMGGARHLAAEQREALQRRPGTAFEPMTVDVEEGRCGLGLAGVDLIVGNTIAFEIMTLPASWLEFGFRCEFTHCLKDAPFLGYPGALAFIGALANELRQGAFRRAMEEEAGDA
jgi:nitrogenase molybdenum-iron protein alpha/beta subunit